MQPHRQLRRRATLSDLSMATRSCSQRIDARSRTNTKRHVAARVRPEHPLIAECLMTRASRRALWDDDLLADLQALRAEAGVGLGDLGPLLAVAVALAGDAVEG